MTILTNESGKEANDDADFDLAIFAFNEASKSSLVFEAGADGEGDCAFFSLAVDPNKPCLLSHPKIGGSFPSTHVTSTFCIP